MNSARSFYNRYWRNEHIKVNPFDVRPVGWTQENFMWHLDFFKPFVKGRLLDFGCGDGQFLELISGYCDYVSGVDISDLAIDKATNSYPQLDFRLLQEGARLPYPDNHFDTISAIEILEHLLDIETVLEEFGRVLKRGGHLLITTSQISCVKMILIMLHSLDSYFYPTSPHVRYFTKKNLESVLASKGFRVKAYKKNGTYCGFIPKGQMVVASFE